MCYVKRFSAYTSQAVLVACLTAVIPARADWTENFDSYPIGSIAGQGGWEGWAGNAAVAGTVTAANASSLPNSLRLISGNDTVHPFTGLSSGMWTLSLQQYLPSTSSGSTWTILMNQYPNNLNWSVQVLCDLSQGVMGVFDGQGAQQGATLSLVKDQWVDLRFEINFDANSVTSYYNNSLVGTMPWQSGGINELQAMDLYPDESPGTAQVGPIYYDNLQLVSVPEPATITLLCLGGIALCCRARKRN